MPLLLEDLQASTDVCTSISTETFLNANEIPVLAVVIGHASGKLSYTELCAETWTVKGREVRRWSKNGCRLNEFPVLLPGLFSPQVLSSYTGFPVRASWIHFSPRKIKVLTAAEYVRNRVILQQWDVFQRTPEELEAFPSPGDVPIKPIGVGDVNINSQQLGSIAEDPAPSLARRRTVHAHSIALSLTPDFAELCQGNILGSRTWRELPVGVGRTEKDPVSQVEVPRAASRKQWDGFAEKALGGEKSVGKSESAGAPREFRESLACGISDYPDLSSPTATKFLFHTRNELMLVWGDAMRLLSVGELDLETAVVSCSRLSVKKETNRLDSERKRKQEWDDSQSVSASADVEMSPAAAAAASAPPRERKPGWTPPVDFHLPCKKMSVSDTFLGREADPEADPDTFETLLSLSPDSVMLLVERRVGTRKFHGTAGSLPPSMATGTTIKVVDLKDKKRLKDPQYEGAEPVLRWSQWEPLSVEWWPGEVGVGANSAPKSQRIIAIKHGQVISVYERFPQAQSGSSEAAAGGGGGSGSGMDSEGSPSGAFIESAKWNFLGDYGKCLKTGKRRWLNPRDLQPQYKLVSLSTGHPRYLCVLTSRYVLVFYDNGPQNEAQTGEGTDAGGTSAAEKAERFPLVSRTELPDYEQLTFDFPAHFHVTYGQSGKEVAPKGVVFSSDQGVFFLALETGL